MASEKPISRTNVMKGAQSRSALFKECIMKFFDNIPGGLPHGGLTPAALQHGDAGPDLGLPSTGMTPAGLAHGGMTPAGLQHGGMTPGKQLFILIFLVYIFQSSSNRFI